MNETKNLLARIFVKTVDMTGKMVVYTTKALAEGVNTVHDVVQRTRIRTTSKWRNFWFDEPDPMARIEKYFRLSGAENLIVKYYDDKNCYTAGRRSVWIRATLNDTQYTVYTKNINEKILIDIKYVTPIGEPIELGYNIDGNNAVYWRGVHPDNVDPKIRTTVLDLMHIIG